MIRFGRRLKASFSSRSIAAIPRRIVGQSAHHLITQAAKVATILLAAGHATAEPENLINP